MIIHKVKKNKSKKGGQRNEAIWLSTIEMMYILAGILFISILLSIYTEDEYNNNN